MTTHTTGYWFLEHALQSHAKSFDELELEMKKFVPRSINDFKDERNDLRNRLIALNPDKDKSGLEKWVAYQIDHRAAPTFQFQDVFSNRFATQAITITFLSHALIEACINAIMVLGLHKRGNVELFEAVEKLDIRQKWTLIPKMICPGYSLPKSHHLFGDLTDLSRRRNSFTHYKINLRDDDNKVIVTGSKEVGIRIDAEGRRQIRRFLKLPYELYQKLLEQIDDLSLKNQLSHILTHRKDEGTVSQIVE